MARVPELDTLAAFELSDGRRMDEAVHIVHVYTVEAHPALPDPTPYRNWTDDEAPGGDDGSTAYGDVGQAMTWEDRARHASRILAMMENDPLMLVDDVRPSTGEDVPANPVWCTYGTAPNAAFVIDRDGRIVSGQLWADISTIHQTLLDLVEPTRAN